MQWEISHFDYLKTHYSWD